MLREYVGSQENRLVEFAVRSFFDGTPRYNPVVLHGPTGTGKTFLALGLSERWRQCYPRDAVFVSCAPDFARGFANAVDTNDLPAFHGKSRGADLFVLDDVHLLPRKAAIQEELMRTIDALAERGRRVLVTDSKTPSADGILLPGLRSRLLGGLVVPLAAPGPAARQLLLRRLVAFHQLSFSDAANTFLASSPSDDANGPLTVPELNHAVLQLGHAAAPLGRPVEIQQVRSFLRKRTADQQPAIADIAAVVARQFSLSMKELRGPSQRRHVIRARGVAMLLAWKLTNTSLHGVGRYFGKRDHTTVLHACRRTESLQETDPAIAEALEELRNQLKTVKTEASSGVRRRRGS